MSWIDKALNFTRRRFKGFTPQELTEGLNKLAVNDSNKMKVRVDNTNYTNNDTTDNDDTDNDNTDNDNTNNDTTDNDNTDNDNTDNDNTNNDTTDNDNNDNDGNWDNTDHRVMFKGPV